MAMAKRKKHVAAAPERVRLMTPWFLRVLVLGAFAVCAAAYAIIRHYTEPRAPMWVTVPSATEIVAPELIEDTD